jgi:hypothetical protein
MTALDPATLAPALAAALDTVRVDRSGTRAELPGRTVEADSPTELRGRLSAALYDALHTGRSPEDGDLPFSLREPELERRFARAVPHRTTCRPVLVADPARVGVTAADQDQLLVLRDGVRAWVPRADLVGGRHPAPGEQVLLTVPAIRPAVSPGFLLVVGPGAEEQVDRHLLRVYVHLADPDAAVEAWAAVLTELAAQDRGYRAKVLSNRLLYPRRDALVVYLSAAQRDLPARLGARLAGIPGPRAHTSVFAERVAPGVAVAWEPADPRPEMRGLSFGQHRAAVVARALVAAALDGAPPAPVVHGALLEAGIDPARPHRNVDSPPDRPGGPA